MPRPTSRPARAVLFVAALTAAALASPAAAQDSPPQVASALQEIVKEHNVDVGGGLNGVKMTCPATVVGQRGNTVACVLFFTDARGEYIRSVLPGYADRAGFLRVVSMDTVVQDDREGLDFVFKVPYGAFPRRPEGRYQVEVLARLFQRSAKGTVILATQTTRFWVEG